MRTSADIETLPTADPEVIASYAERAEPDARLKDPEKIAVSRAEKATKMWAKSSLDPIEAVVCSIAIKDSLGNRVCWCGPNELEVMTRFEEEYVSRYAPTWFAWNGRDFDYRIIWLRGLKYKLPAISHQFNPANRGKLVDLMLEVGGHKRTEMLSLARAAKFFGIPFDSSFDGSMVYAAALREQWALIRDHNLNDVDVLDAIVNRVEG